MKKFLFLILKGTPLSQKFPVFTHNVQCTQYSACEGCVPGRAPKATAVRGEAKGSPCLLQCPHGCPALLSLQICPSSVLLGTGNNPLNLWAAQSLWLRPNCWHSSAVMVLCPPVTSGGALTLLVQECCSLGQILCDAEIPVNVEGFFVFCTFYFQAHSTCASRHFFFFCMRNVEKAAAWSCYPCFPPGHIMPLSYESFWLNLPFPTSLAFI